MKEIMTSSGRYAFQDGFEVSLPNKRVGHVMEDMRTLLHEKMSQALKGSAQIGRADWGQKRSQYP